ncbi:hypothetical protein Snoj_28260 [Streptomyces nojiriensis]|uniref:Uncharacterized protein n=1 Tax=Streptomyces nojiriensis TaxID=66374 RepID=A0ABQ3SL88_9ACTN|nr:hypothetical protein Snoj_28260 [Streptomyces nojiriensis]
MSTRLLLLLRTTLPEQYVLLPFRAWPSKKNVPTMGSPSKCRAVGVPAGAPAESRAEGEDEPGDGFTARASTGWAWAIRSAVQYSSSGATEREGEGEASGRVARGGDVEGNGVACGGDAAGGRGKEGDAEGEAGIEAVGAGVPEAIAAGLASTTVVMLRASVVNHLDLKELTS